MQSSSIHCFPETRYYQEKTLIGKRSWNHLRLRSLLSRSLYCASMKGHISIDFYKYYIALHCVVSPDKWMWGVTFSSISAPYMLQIYHHQLQPFRRGPSLLVPHLLMLHLTRKACSKIIKGGILAHQPCIALLTKTKAQTFVPSTLFAWNLFGRELRAENAPISDCLPNYSVSVALLRDWSQCASAIPLEESILYV